MDCFEFPSILKKNYKGKPTTIELQDEKQTSFFFVFESDEPVKIKAIKVKNYGANQIRFLGLSSEFLHEFLSKTEETKTCCAGNSIHLLEKWTVLIDRQTVGLTGKPIDKEWEFPVAKTKIQPFHLFALQLYPPYDRQPKEIVGIHWVDFVFSS